MCAGALFYAKVDKIVYGATMADIDPDNERIKLTIEYLASQKQNPPQIMQIMRDQCIAELYS
jgi:tRNA(Arg) A34 adenosine deaminase TadA